MREGAEMTNCALLAGCLTRDYSRLQAAGGMVTERVKPSRRVVGKTASTLGQPLARNPEITAS
jgi:hypothetical protein